MVGEEDTNGWDEHKKVIIHRLDNTDQRLDKISTKLGDLIETRQKDVKESKKERADQFKVLHDIMRELNTNVTTYEMEIREEMAVCKIRLDRLEKTVYGTLGVVGTAIGLYILNTLLKLV